MCCSQEEPTTNYICDKITITTILLQQEQRILHALPLRLLFCTECLATVSFTFLLSISTIVDDLLRVSNVFVYLFLQLQI
jgi:hypothetical protein